MRFLGIFRVVHHYCFPCIKSVSWIHGKTSKTDREIRCRFVFSGKNDELTPDFPVFSGKNDELTPDFPE